MGRTKSLSLRGFAIGAAILLTAGCGGDDGASDSGVSCEGAKCDNANEDPNDGPARSCDSLLEDFSGKNMSVAEIQANTDAIAKAILSGGAERCPMSVADIVEALKESGCSGPESTLVSERSQLLNTFTDYRSITEMTCDGKAVFLHFPMRAPDTKVVYKDGEPVVEDGKPVIGADINSEATMAMLDSTFPAIMAETESGVFNFYQSSSKIERLCMPRGIDIEGEIPEGLAHCESGDECKDGETCAALPGDRGVVADFRFFGNSMDFVTSSDRAKTIEAMANALPEKGAGEPHIEASLNIDGNCGVCHPNGGLTMRELESPWVHWDAGGHFSSPDGDKLIEAGRDALGTEGNGFAFEQTVKSGNREWNNTRLNGLFDTIASESEGSRTVTLGTMMRPLLCTDEFNILTSGSRPDVDFSTVAFRRAVLDKNVGSFGDKVDGNHDAFLEHIEKRNWMLWGFSVGPFAAFQLPVQRETLGTLTFLHRAEIDHDYQSKLSSSGFIDDEMVKDILAIDFTRSIFSEERCDLVSVFDQIDPGQFVNEGGVVDGAADLMRTALIAELQGANEQHKVDFLANLEESGTDPKAKVAEMMVACNARDAADVQTDYLDYIGNTTMRASHHESAMEHAEASFLHFRFPGMRGFAMPDIMGQEFVHGLRFDPTTCLLINNYPGANPIVDEPEEPQAPEEPAANDPGESSCQERGCAFNAGFSCQCDAGCEEFGDCCDFDGDAHDGPAASCE